MQLQLQGMGIMNSKTQLVLQEVACSLHPVQRTGAKNPRMTDVPGPSDCHPLTMRKLNSDVLKCDEQDGCQFLIA